MPDIALTFDGDSDTIKVALTNNEWHHIAVWIDGGEDEKVVFVDGKRIQIKREAAE